MPIAASPFSSDAHFLQKLYVVREVRKITLKEEARARQVSNHAEMRIEGLAAFCASQASFVPSVLIDEPLAALHETGTDLCPAASVCRMATSVITCDIAIVTHAFRKVDYLPASATLIGLVI